MITEVKLYSPQGTFLTVLFPTSFQVGRKLGTIGVGTIIIDPFMPYRDLKRDMIITVERTDDEGLHYLEGDSVWFLRGKHLINKPGDKHFELNVEDNLSLLRRRIVAYYEDEDETDKDDYADDMMKEIMDENFGSSATDASRRWATLTLQTDLHQGPIFPKSGFAWRGVLPTLQEIMASAENAGTRILFDVKTVSVDPFTFEFRTYKTFRGVDRRFPTSNNSLLIGSDFNNLLDTELSDDWHDEETHVYIGGEGSGLTRLIEETENSLVTASPYGRVEGWLDDSNVLVSADAIADGNAYLFKIAGRTRLTGKLAGELNSRWGFDIGYGDYVTAQAEGLVFDCWLDAYTLSYDRESGTHVDVALQGQATS